MEQPAAAVVIKTTSCGLATVLNPRILTDASTGTSPYFRYDHVLTNHRGFKVRNCVPSGSTNGEFLRDMVNSQNQRIGTCWSQNFKPSTCPVDLADDLTTVDFDGLVSCASALCDRDGCGQANESENRALCFGYS